ncbi:dTDP-4-amino-4,6-dideoxygalactose transaminase [Flavobacteriaceae bacterium MAR_2010_105]|nr:dTDP-4-amino-4,6-dideoxygalactose transaminase [Flavobacteriaceae bacterium MAR_2010_105]
MINVTKTFLPPQAEYQQILKKAWDTGWMTNRGVLVRELETQLKAYLGVPQLIAMTNGTLPLQIAIKALNLSGEIITTPFSYVATTSSIVWEGCTPVFVDIHPEYLSIDETKIEAAITSKTSAILATHVYGNPCDVEAIARIAQKHHLKVIYDAAHCFGVTYKGESIFNYGDVSTCSFHATKVFHTGEGGAVFTTDPSLYDQVFYHHNFGHQGQEAFQGLGINAKMSEPQAAMGLAVLPYMAAILKGREAAYNRYCEGLEAVGIQTINLRPGTTWNYSYFPVVFKTETDLTNVLEALHAKHIFPRRYFYPSLDQLPYVEDQVCPIAQSIAARVLCLPLYPDLKPKTVLTICQLIKGTL